MEKDGRKPLCSKEASIWLRGIAVILVVCSHYAEWWMWFANIPEPLDNVFWRIMKGMGPYGVGIFFWCSGYGITKSAGENRLTLMFIKKRILRVYFPYLVITFVIEGLTGGLETLRNAADILYGRSFWYMTVLFLFYLAFMIIWFLTKKKGLRLLLITLFTCLMSSAFMQMGFQDFWYLSNPAFLFGIVFAAYEDFLREWINKAGMFFGIVFTAGTFYVLCREFFFEESRYLTEFGLAEQMCGVVIFVICCLYVAQNRRTYGRVLSCLGRHSLTIYLIHTVICMQILNRILLSLPLRFVISAVITAFTAAAADKVLGWTGNMIMTK